MDANIRDDLLKYLSNINRPFVTSSRERFIEILKSDIGQKYVKSLLILLEKFFNECKPLRKRIFRGKKSPFLKTLTNSRKIRLLEHWPLGGVFQNFCDSKE